jgi:hypothetical protein
MPERRLDQVDGRAPVERMAGMGVTEPVRGNRQVETGAAGRPAYYPQNRHILKGGPVFPRPEYRVLGPSCVPQLFQFLQTEAGN